MKKFLTTISALFALALFSAPISATAVAQEVATSSYDSGSDPSCGNNACLPDLSAMLNLVGATGADAKVTPIGGEVAALVEKSSGLNLNGSMNYTGNGCTADCDSLGVVADLTAFEHIKTIGAAAGTVSGETVSVSNQSVAQVLLGIDFDAIGINPPNSGN